DLKMSNKLVSIRKEDSIAYVSLNRPEKYNALNYELFKQIDACIVQLRKDKSLRAVILFGEGDSFCSGLDVKSVSRSPFD
ncbi:enoyl-CoA hydratase-related protein, partial [Vibrio sp. 10N.222.54.F6]|uniref:enoyl-CoA hydratase-related protein n=1 Tax=Vibrio sp. 10N.222.54.F6 TaxID=3229645 RepID=UPI00354C3BAE